MIQKIKNFLKEEEGATMVEYAIMVALIAAICVGAVQILGQNANTTFTNTAGKIAPAAAGS